MSSTERSRKYRESLKYDVEKLNRRKLTYFKHKQKMKTKHPETWKKMNQEYQRNYQLKKQSTEASEVVGYGKNVQALYAATTRAAKMMPRDKHKAAEVAAGLARRFALPQAKSPEPPSRKPNNSVDTATVIAFFNDDEVSRQNPGKNDTLTIKASSRDYWFDLHLLTVFSFCRRME